jgi:aurora kinase
LKKKTHDPNVDIWALGILTYEFLCGNPPFETNNQKKTFQKIKKVDFNMPKHLRLDAQDFINKLLMKDPNQRLPLKDIGKHPFITKWIQPKITIIKQPIILTTSNNQIHKNNHNNEKLKKES